MYPFVTDTQIIAKQISNINENKKKSKLSLNYKSQLTINKTKVANNFSMGFNKYAF